MTKKNNSNDKKIPPLSIPTIFFTFARNLNANNGLEGCFSHFNIKIQTQQWQKKIIL